MHVKHIIDYPTKKRHLHADLCCVLFLKYNKNSMMSIGNEIMHVSVEVIHHAHNCHNGYEITAHFP